MERIVAFPWQKRLRERATVLRYTVRALPTLLIFYISNNNMADVRTVQLECH